MDLEALTLLKLLLVAGLAWLSHRQLKRAESRQSEIRARLNWTLKPQTPIPDSSKLKDESCRSTSATSRTDVNYEDYCAVYDKFWVQREEYEVVDSHMDVEEQGELHEDQKEVELAVCKAPAQTLIGLSQHPARQMHCSGSYCKQKLSYNSKRGKGGSGLFGRAKARRSFGGGCKNEKQEIKNGKKISKLPKWNKRKTELHRNKVGPNKTQRDL